MTAAPARLAHGDPTRYLKGPDENDQPGRGCRCQACRAANTAACYARRQRRAQETWGARPPKYMDAEPVRRHLRDLSAKGVGWRRAAQVSGVSRDTIGGLLHQKPLRQRVRRETGERILAVQAEDALLGREEDALSDGAVVLSAGTLRRLQALVANGWSRKLLAERLGIWPTNLGHLMKQPTVTVARRRSVRQLYSDLWDQPPPETTGHERGTATKARLEAEKAGWPRPAEWDDELIDLPDEELDAELRRRAAWMDNSEAAECWRAHYRKADRSPLIVAGAREHTARVTAARAERYVADKARKNKTQGENT